ncbi:hypothetical protein RKD19_000960 [Streptomyces canus]
MFTGSVTWWERARKAVARLAAITATVGRMSSPWRGGTEPVRTR